MENNHFHKLSREIDVGLFERVGTDLAFSSSPGAFVYATIDSRVSAKRLPPSLLRP